MSKIICDVCGSAYADTADQCPICGTAKRDTSASKPDTQGSDSGYNYVKGGRFSHANVRKHNSGKELTRMSAEKPEEPKSNMPPLPVNPKPEKQEKPKAEKPKPEKQEKPKVEKPKPVREEKPKPVKEVKPKVVREEKPVPQKDGDQAGRITNIILAVIVLILLALVVFAGIYIVRNYETLFPSANTPTEPQGTQQTVGGVRIPCVGITLPALDKVESAGDPVDLGITFNPSTTTDEVTYVSSDPAIATVNFKGQITVHSTGSVTITVTCGDQTAELSLECVFVIPTNPTDPVDPSDPSQPSVPSVEDGKLLFVDAKGKETKDVTFSKYGEEYQLYKGEIDASLVTFTSSNPEVVTVDEKGKIKVVGKGEAVITAQCGDQKIQCNIRCNKVEVPAQRNYELNKTDITMSVGYKFHLQLSNKETGAPVSGLEWRLSMPGTSYVLLEETATGVRVTGNEVTVGVPGVLYVRVMCDYEGVTYECIFRIVAPQEPEAN